MRLLLCLCLLSQMCLATVAKVIQLQDDRRVANYSIGRVGTKDYEQFSFWVKDGQASEITYSYGRTYKEISVKFVGVDLCKGRPCFKVDFANGNRFYIQPVGINLRITDEQGRYSKLFRWQYEGPRDGRGTFCTPCAEDENDAMRLLNTYYLKK